MQTGNLIVSARTANGAYPVAQAQVTVTTTALDGAPVLVRIATTDQNGNTAPIPLATPPESTSQQPSTNPPYARYDVRVDHPDYRAYIATGVDIFPNVTARLAVELEPAQRQLPPERVVFPPEPLRTLS